MYKKKNRSTIVLTSDQQRLVEKFVPFAMKLGWKMHRRCRAKVPMEDLQQEACMGLCEAATRFDIAWNVAFSTYAYTWCQKMMLRAIRDEHRAHNIPAVAYDMDNPPVYDENGEKNTFDVAKLLDRLNSMERKVVKMLYGIDCDEMSFAEVAEMLHLTKQRVHIIYEKAMGKMEQFIVHNS